MGQYYIIANIDKKEYFRPSDGVKLMEFSYYGNETILTLLKKIQTTWKNGRIFLIGDYAESFEDDDSYDNEKIKELEIELGLYNKLFLVEGESRKISLYHHIINNFKKVKVIKNLKTEDFNYLYNKNSNEFIDFNKLPHEYIGYNEDSNEIYSSRISPLPLLIVLGNGRGGGDFNSENESNKYIGKWINDTNKLIVSKDPIPKHSKYIEFVPNFHENKDYISSDDFESVKDDYLIEISEFNYLLSNIKKIETINEDILNVSFSYQENVEDTLKYVDKIHKRNTLDYAVRNLLTDVGVLEAIEIYNKYIEDYNILIKQINSEYDFFINETQKQLSSYELKNIFLKFFSNK